MKKKVFIFITIAVVAVVIFLIIRNRRRQQEEVTTGAITAGGSTSGTGSTTSMFPLRKGSRGEKVKRLQHFYNYSFRGELVEDGIWGSKTDAAVKSKISTGGSITQAQWQQLEPYMETADTNRPPVNWLKYTDELNHLLPF